MSNKSQIQNMFKTISPTYDLLNSILSFQIDKWWRRKTIAHLHPKNQKKPNQTILDLCCGTLGLSLQILQKSSPATKVIALDFCYEMLLEGKKKVPFNLQNNIILICADIEHLPLRKDIADGAVMGFCLRNLINRCKGLKEIKRALKPSSKIAILEFSQPRSKFFRTIYYFYSFYILPKIGGLISGDAKAYQYLPDSVTKFYSPRQLLQIMQNVGFTNVHFSLLTGGIAALHVGEKKNAC